jgi:hypothetical protein
LQFTDYEIFSLSNGLSDHEAQLLIVHLQTPIIKKNDIYYTRTVNDYNIADFRMKLIYENWESVFNNSDINTSFNQFLNIFLILFMHLFHYQEGKSINRIHGLLQVLLFPVERKELYMWKLKKTKILKLVNITRNTVKYRIFR